MRVEEFAAKSVLVPSKLPDTDFVVNPYVGCAYACAYCYASFMGRFSGEPVEAWGDYVRVKTNAVEVFERELGRLRMRRKSPSILISSVTDPYQGVESKYRLTRGILSVLAREPYPGHVSILTKSHSVLRDVDLLRRLPDVEVGVTVTTTDDKISRFVEMRAPSSTVRLRTLKKLHEAGIDTYAFIGPLLPHFHADLDGLEHLFRAVAESGVHSVFVEHVNISPYIRRRLLPVLEHQGREVRDAYLEGARPIHRVALQREVQRLIDRYELRLRLSRVLEHGKSAVSTETTESNGLKEVRSKREAKR